MKEMKENNDIKKRKDVGTKGRCKCCLKEVEHQGKIRPFLCPYCEKPYESVGINQKKSNDFPPEKEKSISTAPTMVEGQNMDEDQKNFNEKLQKAQEGDVHAMVNVGYYYCNGIGTEQCNRLAIFYFQKASDLGNPIAQYNLGLYYQQGIYVTKNEAKAVEYFEKSAEKEYVNGELQLGRYYMNVNSPYYRPEEGFRLLRKVSISNPNEVCFELAQCYAKALGTRKNPKKAIYFMEMAVKIQDVTALFLYAKWYREGVAVKQDCTRAFRMVEECVKLRHRPAYDLFGEMYLRGEGVLEDWNEGIHWKRQGDDHSFLTERYISQLETLPRLNIPKLVVMVKSGNNVYMQYALGLRYEQAGEDVMAFQCFEKCAKQDLPQGMYKIATYYEEGIVVPKNFLKAVEWYEKAVKFSYAQAQCALGLCFEEGRGVSKNEMLARGLYEKSARQGLGKACYHLGLCYQTGVGTEISLTKAQHWFLRGVEEGYALGSEFITTGS